MSLWLAVAGLVVPVALGAGAGALGVFKRPEGAIDVLNRYALYFAFPALIFDGLASSVIGLPHSAGFWLLVPLVLLVLAASVRSLFPGESSTLALVVAFGNVAYLGLPLVERVLGASAIPLASLAVAIHVTLALSVGPVLLLRWSGATPSLAAALRRAVGQPLLWAPVVGLLARLVPDPARQVAVAFAAPVGKSAAPVALFLLGLYLHAHRKRLEHLQRADALHTAIKLVAMPALTFGLTRLAFEANLVELAEARVLCLLSAMPAAITTFAIARDLRVGTERVTRAIVVSTLGSAVTLPAAAWLVQRWLPTW